MATDDQLRAEAVRRFPSGVALALPDFSDDQLHAEYVRRFGGQPPIEKYRALQAERDEWKRKASHYQAEAERLSEIAAAAAEADHRKPVRLIGSLADEAGPGLAARPLAAPHKRETLSVAELADLLCDDAP